MLKQLISYTDSYIVLTPFNRKLIEFPFFFKSAHIVNVKFHNADISYERVFEHTQRLPT